MRAKYILLLVMSVMIVSCSSLDKEPESTERPVNVLYNEAMAALNEGGYSLATELFDEVERQHPYSKWATQAQIMAAYAHYLDQSYDEAILALDRFIELHPGNNSIAYAHYLKALSYYEQIADIRRDQEITAQALNALNTLIRRYPDSEYTRDAMLKKDLVLDHLAGKEMEVGRYYLKRNEFNAAINRFRRVIQEYQTSSHAAEALHRLVESYLSLGLEHEAMRVAAVLGYNYPGSPWYERSYKILNQASREELASQQGFLKRSIDSLLRAD